MTAYCNITTMVEYWCLFVVNVSLKMKSQLPLTTDYCYITMIEYSYLFTADFFKVKSLWWLTTICPTHIPLDDYACVVVVIAYSFIWWFFSWWLAQLLSHGSQASHKLWPLFIVTTLLDSNCFLPPGCGSPSFYWGELVYIHSLMLSILHMFLTHCSLASLSHVFNNFLSENILPATTSLRMCYWNRSGYIFQCTHS